MPDPTDPPADPPADDVDDVDDETFIERIEGAVANGFTRAAEALGLGAGRQQPDGTTAPPAGDDPPKPDDKGGEVKPPPAPAASSAGREDDFAGRVRAVLDDVHDKDEIRARLKTVEERTAETPPARVRRSTRVMWGG